MNNKMPVLIDGVFELNGVVVKIKDFIELHDLRLSEIVDIIKLTVGNRIIICGDKIIPSELKRTR